MSLSRVLDWLLGRVPCLRQRVIVNLRAGNAIGGVLWSQSRGWLVIKRPQLLEPGAKAVPMDGDAVIECAQVAFIQCGLPS